ncbi:MAG: serine hydrolase domain-containing protein [Candidatus Thermochlorobacter sp.]
MKQVFLALLFLAIATAVQSCAKPLPKEQATVQLEHTLDSICKAHSIVGLSVAVVSPDSILFSRGFGWAQLGASRPMTDSTYVRIASISKTITALALMQLYEQGKFKLDDDVSSALGFTLRNPYFPNEPITYRQLLQHTSSLLSDEVHPQPYYVLWRDASLSLRDVLSKNGKRYQDSVYRSLWAQNAPGKTFAYSNLGYALLGTLVEIHSGERFDQYCARHIFKPLGLACSFNVQDINPEKLAYPYRLVEGKWIAQVDSVPNTPNLENYVAGSNALLFSPQGGLRVSAKELAKLAQVFLNRGKWRNSRLVNDTTLLRMERDSLATSEMLFRKYALGLHHAKGMFEAVEMTGHPGLAYGLLSGWYYNREHGIGVVVIITGARYKTAENEFYDVERSIYAAIEQYLRASLLLAS